MKDRLISVRLDEEAVAALRVLTKDGASRSQAIREALVERAAGRDRRLLASEAAALAADEDDRREAAEVLDLMESLRAAG
ncbi:MAG TPA: ribbon-helix-helix protein, CopG family [Gaiellaceae bacterium]|nr:ribbon-helix-helix protein, CopG family [Gaiellaceae bacterium]